MRHRLSIGQRDLFNQDAPPVQYCRGCRRRLRGRQAIARGYGRTCWQIHQGRVERRIYCGVCGKRLHLEIEPGCTRCGNGFETQRTRTRTVIKRVRQKATKGAKTK